MFEKGTSGIAEIADDLAVIVPLQHSLHFPLPGPEF